MLRHFKAIIYIGLEYQDLTRITHRISVSCLAFADDTSLGGRAAGRAGVGEVVGELHVAVTGYEEVVQHPGHF